VFSNARAIVGIGAQVAVIPIESRFRAAAFVSRAKRHWPRRRQVVYKFTNCIRS